MAQSNTAEKIVESPAEKLARIIAENESLKKQSAAMKSPGNTPSSVSITVDGMGFQANSKTFSSGSVGFHANGKITLADGKRYTLNVLMVEIGSKPTK